MEVPKLFKKNIIILIILLIVVAFVSSFFSGFHLNVRLAEEYTGRAAAISTGIATVGGMQLLNEDAVSIRALIEPFIELGSNAYVLIHDAAGKIIFHTFSDALPDVVLNNIGLADDSSVRTIRLPGLGNFFDVSSAIPGGFGGFVHVGLDRASIRRYIGLAILGQMIVILLLYAVTVIIGYISFKNTIFKALTKLTDYAKKLLAHDYTAKVDAQFEDEFDILSNAMQSMAIDLQGIFARIERTTADLTDSNIKLNDTLGYLSAIIENIADGLLVTDLNGIIIRLNPAFLDIVGAKEDDLLDKNIRDVLQPEMVELTKRATGRSQRELVSNEISLSGNRIGKALATPIYQQTDDVSEELNYDCIGVVTLLRDITREKEIDRMKTDFLSTVSHELRTPLTSVLGFAKIIDKRLKDVIFPLVKSEDLKAERAVRQINDNIHIIVSEGERLTSLINDVLDIAKMEAGMVDWKMEPVSISETVDRARMATAALFEQENLPIIVDIEEGLPYITGDRDRLLQVIINLLSNAVKFTEVGSVTCTASKEDGDISISVIDTGIGIAESDREKVFDKFRQVGDTLTQKPTGTGLGLPICKQIVEHHGGEIRMESNTGGGSSFSFTLPISRDKQLDSGRINMDGIIEKLRDHIGAVSNSVDDHKKTVLVVDDEINIRALLRQELEAVGYIVAEAKDGMEAISQAKKDTPDLIILDVMMPEMNGFDVAAVLKNDPVTMAIPIIILSIMEDKERGYNLGVDRYITKPVDTDALLREVSGLLSQETSNKKVLVVDEHESTLHTLSEVLEAKGFRVAEARNEDEAVEKVKSEKPDLIIVDELSNRHEVVRMLRYEKGLENILFVLLAEEKAADADKS